MDNLMNKKINSKYDYLNTEIVDNFFVSDTTLSKKFIQKYNIKAKVKDIQNYIFRFKNTISIQSILNMNLKKLAFNRKLPVEVILSKRYFNQLIREQNLGNNLNQTSIILVIDDDEKVRIIVKKTDASVPIQYLYQDEHNKPSNTKKDFKSDENIVKDMKGSNKKENILVIADLHLPFENEEYLNFCKKMQEKYNTTKTIFIGDIIDNHYQSFHPTDPDGYSAGEELRRAKDKVQDWYKAFTNAVVIKGNHDVIFQRRAFAHGLSREWIKTIHEVLEVPHWYFKSRYEFQDILFVHGTGMSGVNAAYNKALYENKSVVMGHQHTIANITYVDQRRFGMIVGCGISTDKYAFNYAKFGKKPVILSCGIITKDNVPIIETM